MGAGLCLLAIGLPLALLPGHLGVPVLLFGLIMVLKHAFWARRLFMRLKRRHPNWIMPLRRLLRPKPEIAPVVWQQTLRTERFVFPKGRRLAGLRRRFLKRPRSV